jgi:mRNA interferase MazF
VRRGELWTISGGADYTGKPRPAVVVQDNAFPETMSITVCPTTGDPGGMPAFRVIIPPNSQNGLEQESRVMTDKLSTIPRSKVGKYIGTLSTREMAKVDEAIMSFLGLGLS